MSDHRPSLGVKPPSGTIYAHMRVEFRSRWLCREFRLISHEEVGPWQRPPAGASIEIEYTLPVRA